ncbi:MAG: YkgJ family cysteine cluster protein [bacterium]
MTEKSKYVPNPKTFYYREGGLRFSCKPQCAACCKITGRVEITENDISQMATHLGIAADKFRQQYTKKDNEQLLLQERSDDSCVMLSTKDKCMVYPVRPLQCRTYPFWDEVLANDFTWLLEKGFCPGIDEGKRYSPQEIDEIRQDSNEAGGY